jgi:hypothetical protein
MHKKRDHAWGGGLALLMTYGAWVNFDDTFVQ